jgi:tetratricopeptide (TPR) repeat protein
MNSAKTPENIILKIKNNEISLRKGIKFLLSLQHFSEKIDIILQCRESLKSISQKYRESFYIFKTFLELNQRSIIRLNSAKELVMNFKSSSEGILKYHIQKDPSALFLTEFYKFLCKQNDELSRSLRETLVGKYIKTYEVSYKEALFFIDLEASQIDKKKDLDLVVGYFKKFSTPEIQLLKEGTEYNLVIKSEHVRALNLSRWEFEKIPESIGFLSELVFLNLSSLNLKIIPETLTQLSKLEDLNLNGNTLAKIPDWLIHFSDKYKVKSYIKEGVYNSDSKVLGLLEILCGKKILKAQDEEDVLSWETAFNYKINNEGYIIGIYIKDENIEMGIFPNQICLLDFLQELDMPETSIESIPECIGNLNSLVFLNLSLNRIKTIPESIEKLKNLEYMNIDHNLLSEKELLEVKWFRNGIIPLEQDKFDETIEECLITLKTYPNNMLALFHLGIAYRETGKLNSAKKAYKRFLSIDPRSSLVWSSLSDIYHQEGNFEKAISAIKNALNIEPNIPLLWSNLGLNFRKLGKYDDAIESYLHSLTIDDRNEYIWKDLATIYRDKGEFMKAIDAEERALDIILKSEKNSD